MANEINPEQQHEQQLQGASGKRGGGIVAYVVHRAKPYVPPWLLAAVPGVAAPVASIWWEGETLPAVLLTGASAALTAGTYVIARGTGAARRAHSTITVGLGTVWLTACALAGPTAPGVLDLYSVGAPTLALSWNIRQVMRRNPDLIAAAGGDGSIKEAIGLAKAKLSRPKVEPNRVTVGYELEAGQTHDDAAKALKPWASALDLAVSAVRHSPDPESARRGEYVFVPVDVLKEPTWWPGPSAVGGSIADPIVIGLYDNGDLLTINILEALHILIMGVTGAGKTEAAITLLAEILTRRDVIVWLSDPKQGQDLGEAFGACDWVVTNADGANLMTESLRVTIPARQAWLGAHGYRSWEPAAAEVQEDPAHTCRADGAACFCPGMPFLVGWFEEAANTLAANGDDVFTTIAQEARSAGVWLVISMQRASGYQISTDTRASLPAALCFGVDERDAAFALPSDVLDAGANPGGWGNRYPGYCYLVARGVDPDRYTSPGRTYRNDPVALEAVREKCAVLRMSADGVTEHAAASVAGRAYTDRPRPARITADGAQVITSLATPQEAPDMTDTADGGADVDPRTDPIAAGRSWVDPEDADRDPREELPADQDGDDTPFVTADGGRKPQGEEARQLLADALAQFERAGQMIVGPKDFMDWCARVGLSRSWVSKALAKAAADGRLQPTSEAGRWRIVPTLTPSQ